MSENADWSADVLSEIPVRALQTWIELRSPSIKSSEKEESKWNVNDQFSAADCPVTQHQSVRHPAEIIFIVSCHQ